LDRKRYVALAVALLILIAITRILLTYKVTAQGFDEACHVAAAIEYLDKGTYTLENDTAVLHPAARNRRDNNRFAVGGVPVTPIDAGSPTLAFRLPTAGNRVC
jgi:hypothetical protein